MCIFITSSRIYHSPPHSFESGLVSGVVGTGRLGLREGLALYLNEWGVYIARHLSGDD